MIGGLLFTSVASANFGVNIKVSFVRVSCT